MNAVFDYFDRKEIPTLILCNPYLEPVAGLGLAHNIKNILRFNGISELEFDFPESMDGGETKLETYSKIKTKMVVLVENIGNYIIIDCPEDTSGMVPIKHVKCQSLEAELMYRRMTSFSGTFNFYSPTEPESTLLGAVVKVAPAWTIEYVDPDLVDMYRTFEINNSTVYQFLTSTVETAYNCVFTFNTFNRSILAYSIPNLEEDSGVYFSFNNVNKSVSLTEFSDEIVTVMYCYGGNGLSIYNVNPLGTNAIYNFDHFKTLEWMSQDLIDAIDAWEEKIDNQELVYANHNIKRNICINKVIEEKSKLVDAKNLLAALQTTYNGLVAANVSASTIALAETDVANQKVVISKKNLNVALAQNEQDLEDAYLRKIVNELKFTGEKRWSSLLSDVSSIQSLIIEMAKTWKATYYATVNAPGFDVAQLEAMYGNINILFDVITNTLADILSLVMFKEYWYITQDDIDTVLVKLDRTVNYVTDLYNIFYSLMSNTPITIDLNSYKIKLESYKEIILYKDNFTKEQYLKLQKFFYENTYSNTNIIITDLMTEKQIQEQSQKLYDQSKAVLERVSKPRFEFEGDFINLFYLKEYEDIIEKLDFPKQVRIELANGEIITPALLEIDYTYDNPDSFSMKLSTRVKLNTSNFRFADLFIDTASGAAGVTGINGGVNTATTSTITSTTSLTGTNILNVSNALISKLGYISFGVTPPTEYGNNQGVWLGWNSGAKLSLYSSDIDYLQWDGTKLLVSAQNFTLDSAGNITATSADLSGKITASEGAIGGWNIGATNLSAGTGTNTVGMDSSSGSIPTFYAGSSDPATAPFRVYSNGTMIATSACVTGSIVATSGYFTEGTIGGWIIATGSLFAGSGSTRVGMDSTGSNPAFYAGSIVSGSAPFRVYTDGRLYAESVYVAGSVIATSGSAGGWRITSGSLSIGSGSYTVALDSGGINPSFSAGSSVTNTAPFRVYNDGRLYATDAYISGLIIATTGSIGGWKIGATAIQDVLGLTGMSSASTAADDVRFWAGSIVSSTAPFRVTESGALNATSACVSGSIYASWGTIGGWSIGITDLHSGTDLNYVAMDSGGTNPAISAGSPVMATAPFRVTHDGKIYASSGSIGGNLLTETSIGSNPFVSGLLGSGWNISSTGTAEFQNIIARGIIRTSVFEKDTISAINGMVLISKSDVLAADMSALDSATLQITGETTFVTNEVVRIKDGVSDEWMLVTGILSGSAYTVTRDHAGSYDPNANPAWKKGTAVASLGSMTTNTGFIYLDSSACPVIDIYNRNSTTAADYSLKARLGSLSGITDSGLGLTAGNGLWGLYTNNAYLSGSIVANGGFIGGSTSGWSIIAGKIYGGTGAAYSGLIQGTGTTKSFFAGASDNSGTSAKFYVTAAGDMYANSASIVGTISASSGTIGGWNITSSSIVSGSIALKSGSAPMIIMGATTASMTGTGVFMGSEPTAASYVFRVGNPTDAYFLWNGNNVFVKNAALELSGANSYISIGASAPTSASTGTGIWIDRDNINGLVTGSTTWMLNNEGLFLPHTTGSSIGIIWKQPSDSYDYSPFIHDFSHPTGGVAIPMGQNLFIGFESGNFTAGSGAGVASMSSYNIGIGYNSLHNINDGSRNIAIGTNSLQGQGSGDANVAIGSSSMRYTTDSFNNIAIGECVLHGTEKVDYNIAIGNYSLYNNTGDYNIAVGNSSLYSNTSGSYNISVGYQDLYNNNTGKSNIAIGYETLYNNRSGSFNIGIGTNALWTNLYGNENIAIGQDTLRSLSTGYSNIALGYQAMEHSDNTQYNLGIGFKALHNNSGNDNIALGGNSTLYLNTTGNDNVAIGSFALASNLYGGNNVAIGTGALYNEMEFSYNTAVGYHSLYNTTGWGNTALGTYSGEVILSSTLNTFIGYSSGSHASQASSIINSTAIGANSYTTADNQIVLGDSNITQVLTYGGLHIGGTSAPGVDNLIVDGKSWTAGSVMIGSTSASGIAKLNVVGTQPAIFSYADLTTSSSYSGLEIGVRNATGYVGAGLNIHKEGNYDGTYLTSYAPTAAYWSTGGRYDGGGWALATSASWAAIIHSEENIIFKSDRQLSIGTLFVTTERMRLNDQYLSVNVKTGITGSLTTSSSFAAAGGANIKSLVVGDTSWFHPTNGAVFIYDSYFGLGGLYCDTTVVAGDRNYYGANAGDMVARGDGRVGGGLYVGGSTVDPTANTITLNDGTNTHKIDGIDSITLFVDGGASVITTGDKLTATIPYNCTIIEWEATSSDKTSGTISGSIVKYHYNEFPTTASTVYTGTLLSSSTKGTGSSFTSNTLAADNILQFSIFGTVTSIKKLAVSLKVRKT